MIMHLYENVRCHRFDLNMNGFKKEPAILLKINKSCGF